MFETSLTESRRYMNLAIASCFAVGSTAIPAATRAVPVKSESVALSGTVTPKSVRVPFELEEIFGQRPVVRVALGPLPYRMVLHSNANFYLQVDHRHAALAGVTGLIKRGAYGIQSAGKVSPLGMDGGTMPRMTIGGQVWLNTPTLVFETPGDDATGMLGLKWITANRVVLDYAHGEVEFNSAPLTASRRAVDLSRLGYASFPMTRDSVDGRYYLAVAIGGVSRKLVVSTVASSTIDTDFARDARLNIGSKVEDEAGPRGAMVPVFLSKDPVLLKIAGQASYTLPAVKVSDIYAYSSVKRPSDAASHSGGMIGEDFLKAHGAVVDFGGQRLYLKQ